MATNYVWIISAMDTAPSEDGLTDVVKTIHWRYNATEVDGETTWFADIYGSMGCVTPSETDFTSYPDLTYEQVCGWLEAGLNVDDLRANLDSQIANQKNPPIVNLPLPWNN
jgi:hypothetical protein